MRGQRNGAPRPYSRISRPEPHYFLQVTPQLYSRGWVDHIMFYTQFIFVIILLPFEAEKYNILNFN
jgi:hypothetical protein